MHTSNTNHDETLKDFRIAINQLVDDDNMPEVLALIEKDRERVVREAKSKGHWYMHDSFNYDSGYIAHCVCGYSSDEEDVIKGHVRWEIAKLSNPTQENTTVYNIAGGDEYKIMGEKVTGVNTLTVHDLDKPNQAQEKESDD
jgi:hypothetical protein